MKKLVVLISVLCIYSQISYAAQLFYMYSTDFKRDEADGYKYHYSNAFDNDEKTLWCFEHTPGSREEIILYFPKTVEIRRITIKNGVNPKINKDIVAGGIKELEIVGEFSKNNLYIDEGLLSKTVALSPPIATNRVVLSVYDVYNKESDLICVRDIVISGVPDNLISTSINKLYKQKEKESRFWGKWQGGTSEGAYEKFIFLGVEGNYIFIYSPYDPDLKGTKASGTYKIGEGDIIFTYKNESIKGRFEQTESAKPRLIIEDDRFKGVYYFEP